MTGIVVSGARCGDFINEGVSKFVNFDYLRDVLLLHYFGDERAVCGISGEDIQS